MVFDFLIWGDMCCWFWVGIGWYNTLGTGGSFWNKFSQLGSKSQMAARCRLVMIEIPSLPDASRWKWKMGPPL